MRTPPDIASSERGTAAIEFALVLLLVLVVALALVQTGLLVRDRLLLEGRRALGRMDFTVLSPLLQKPYLGG